MIPLIYKTTHFDQYLHLDISLNIFWFSVNKLKTNLKFEKIFSLVVLELVETSPLIYKLI